MIDPAALAVVVARLGGVAHEMGAVLQRSAFSPNINERADCSAAVFAADGTLLMQAEHIPVHLGAMPASVHAVLAMIEQRSLRLRDGDQFIVNDPFAGGTHLNDVTVVAPVVAADGRVLGWVANRAHHADVGGIAPGSMSPHAVEIQQEGIRIPPVALTPDVEAVFVAASRTPDERRGDLAAQIGANRIGVERFAELGLDAGTIDSLIDYGERRMRAALASLPDGAVTVRDVLDSTGRADEGSAAIVCTVVVDGDTIRFDFRDSARQRTGNVNAVRAVTVSAAVFALRCATDPDIPANGGALRPVEVLTTDGSIVAASPPVAVGSGNVEVSQRVADVCLAALAHFVPHRIGAAGQGTMNNVLIGGDGFVHYETIGGGQGGRPWAPGMSGVHTAMTNTLDTPVEALERVRPLRIRTMSLRRGSGGGGAMPGGDGIERHYEFLAPATVSLVTERRRTGPPGAAGGAPGTPGRNRLRRDASSTYEELPDKDTFAVAPGDVLEIATPGGGGWGDQPE